MIALLVAFSLVYVASAVPLPSECGTTVVKPDLTNVGKVVGGKEAVKNSWPWQIQVRRNNGHYCGASILSNDWLLCAAHCVYQQTVAPYSLHAGRHNYQLPESDTVQTSNARRLVWHPSYNQNTITNDVALIQLTTPLTFTDSVRPVCLAKTAPAGSTNAWVTGWGEDNLIGVNPVLKQALLPIVPRSTCESAAYWGSNIANGMVCAGYADGLQGACNGDSGGPLVVESGNVFSQVGVVSWGHRTCDAERKPTVFGDVAYYHDWITSQITRIEREDEEMMNVKFHPRLGAAFRAFAKALEA